MSVRATEFLPGPLSPQQKKIARHLGCRVIDGGLLMPKHLYVLAVLRMVMEQTAGRDVVWSGPRFWAKIRRAALRPPKKPPA